MRLTSSGGAGAEGFLDVKGSKGDPHKIVITLSNLFTTPLATGVPFSWKDLTPVKMMALDEFVLWVNAETPYKTSKEYIEAAKKAGPGKMKMAGTGSRQEDQIITVSIEQKTGAKFTYIPFKGGGDVAVQLVGKHADSTVNNPIEAVAHWRGGKLRPLCVFDPNRMPYKEKVTDKQSWADIPTCKEQGLDVQYTMLRGIFLPGKVAPDVTAFYLDLFRKIANTAEYKDYMEKQALKPSFLTGPDMVKFLEQDETLHKQLMTEAGFVAATN